MLDLTVVVPTYNGAQHLAATLDSLAAQQVQPQVVVVDDGSVDESAAIAEDHPVVSRVVRQSNSGVAVARNRGLAASTTEWVAFLDQDDLWHANRAQHLASFVALHSAVQVLVSREVKFATVEERELLRQQYPDVGDWADAWVGGEDHGRQLSAERPLSAAPAFELLSLERILQGPVSTTTSFVARRDLVNAVGGFAPHARAMDDYVTLVNMARLAPVYRIEEASVFYRVHLSATSRSTKLALPFLTTALALQCGGMLRATQSPDPALTGPLHRHLFEEAVNSDEFWEDSAMRRAVLNTGRALFGDVRRSVARAAMRRAKDRVRR